MYQLITFQTTTLCPRNLRNRSSRHCGTVAALLLMLALACFAFSPQVRAVCQEGCLTNQNTVLGEDVLLNNTGLNNTAIGFDALFGNITGDSNTASGSSALYSNITGNENTANGAGALFRNRGGNDNTATGFRALWNNQTGDDNTAIGKDALFTNRGGHFNAAVGVDALYSNTYGNSNTATGAFALQSNTTGGGNTASGLQALDHNTTGDNNTASGSQALENNTTGNYNTANGTVALLNNTTGSNNTAIGWEALVFNNGDNNIAVGFQAGYSLTTGSNNVDIGARGHNDESNTIRIGQQGTQSTTLIAGISGATVPTGVAVIVDAGGHLGTTTSSARLKEKIQPMDKASEAILALQPVTFRYKQEIDPSGIPQFGLVAEEVEKVNPDLVARDADGKAYTVRYEAVNAMLLNEFLKEHRRNEAQQTQIEALTAMVKEQAAQIQKVSAQLAAASPSGGGLEVSRRAQQMVVNIQ
jgi:Chaperone of endosialidase